MRCQSNWQCYVKNLTFILRLIADLLQQKIRKLNLGYNFALNVKMILIVSLFVKSAFQFQT